MRIRPYVSVALLALAFGAIVLSPSSSLGQVQLETQRKILSKVDPAYPELAQKMQISGTVRVEAAVAPDGKPRLTQVLGGHPLLAKAAVDAIEKWKWLPAPQETKELVILNFRPR